MFSAFKPSKCALGAVGSRHCGARGAVGGSVPCSRVSPQSWTLPANLGLPRVSSPTLYPLGHDLYWFYGETVMDPVGLYW